MDYSPWGCKELDTIEQLFHFHSRLNVLGRTRVGEIKKNPKQVQE